MYCVKRCLRVVAYVGAGAGGREAHRSLVSERLAVSRAGAALRALHAPTDTHHSSRHHDLRIRQHLPRILDRAADQPSDDVTQVILRNPMTSPCTPVNMSIRCELYENLR